MKLSRDEAICLVLSLSENQKISSLTKLNKLLARLNSFFIPIDIKFELNKWGSYAKELSELQENEFYGTKRYSHQKGSSIEYYLKPKGEGCFEEVRKKLKQIMDDEEFEKVKEEIKDLSKLDAESISEDEHIKLLVDVEFQGKLKSKINILHVDLFDLYNESKSMPEETIADVKLKGLIEFCFYLTRYLKEIRFKRLSQNQYDFEAYMFDYYFVHNLEKIIPFLKEQIKKKDKDYLRINKYYQYFIHNAEYYPFSIQNPDLKELVA